jgi:hypothetical protein
MFHYGRIVSTSSRDLLAMNFDSTYSSPKYHDPAHALEPGGSSKNGSAMMNSSGTGIGYSTMHGKGIGSH